MSTVELGATSEGDHISRRSLEAPSRRLGEAAIKAFFAMCAAVSVAATTAIVFALLLPAIDFFREVPINEFLFGTTWAPAFANASFGVLPIVVGTLIVVVFAMLVAVPVGLACAIYLSEYAPRRVRKVLKPLLEVLAGIPTVAIGLFAYWSLTPMFQDALPFLAWRGETSIGVAGIAVGFLIVPLVASVSDDAMRSVPAGLRDGAYALGASKLRVSLRVVLPGAISGVIAAFVLAASRAVGETMVVAIAAGAGNPNLTFNPAEGVQAMTSYIASTATGEIAQGTVQYDAIFAVGFLLFLMTLAMNVFAVRMVRRFREAYE